MSYVEFEGIYRTDAMLFSNILDFLRYLNGNILKGNILGYLKGNILYRKVLTYLYGKAISLADILTLICQIQCMRDKERREAAFLCSRCLCFLYVKFDKLKLNYMPN